MSVLKALKCLLFDQMERESIQTVLHSSCLPSSQELMHLAVANVFLRSELCERMSPKSNQIMAVIANVKPSL